MSIATHRAAEHMPKMDVAKMQVFRERLCIAEIAACPQSRSSNTLQRMSDFRPLHLSLAVAASTNHARRTNEKSPTRSFLLGLSLRQF